MMSNSSSSINKVYVLEQILTLMESTKETEEDVLIERFVPWWILLTKKWMLLVGHRHETRIGQFHLPKPFLGCCNQDFTGRTY
jgi:hypothetical protein